MPSIEATPERFTAFRKADPDEPLLMLNLLKFKDRAEYSDDEDDAPCSGEEAYKRYLAETAKLTPTIGAEVLLKTNARRTVIAPDDEDWDLMLVVKYPNRAAMLKMLANEDYRKAARHRRAALADSRLIEMDPNS